MVLQVERVTLRGAAGFEAVIITYGAAIHALKVPDRAGRSEDILLGNDDLAGYLAHRRYFGATIGRYGNRIGAARFTLDGKTYQLDVNNGVNMLHGGNDGFDRKVWSIAAIEQGSQPAVVLAYTSPDGEGGFPGELTVRATYRLTGPTELSLTYEATTDRPTMVGITNHAFFNLNGALSASDVLDHRLMIAADQFLAVDAGAIPLADAAAQRRRHAVRFSPNHSDRRAHSRPRRPAADRARLRSQLLPEAGKRRAARGPAGGAAHRARHGSSDRSARPAVLFRQFPRRHLCAARAIVSIASPTRCVSNPMPGPIRRTVRTFPPRGSIPASSIAAP